MNLPTTNQPDKSSLFKVLMTIFCGFVGCIPLYFGFSTFSKMVSMGDLGGALFLCGVMFGVFSFLTGSALYYAVQLKLKSLFQPILSIAYLFGFLSFSSLISWGYYFSTWISYNAIVSDYSIIMFLICFAATVTGIALTNFVFFAVKTHFINMRSVIDSMIEYDIEFKKANEYANEQEKNRKHVYVSPERRDTGFFGILGF